MPPAHQTIARLPLFLGYAAFLGVVAAVKINGCRVGASRGPTEAAAAPTAQPALEKDP